jgi:adenylate cyclase
MFTDLVGSTAAAQRDEKAALALQIEHERLLRPIFQEFGGREIKSTGDGFLVEFESALRAVECAIEAQRSLRSRNVSRPSDPVTIRIGIHLGDVEERNGDIFGDAVNIAARVQPLADPGGICVSEPVLVQVRNKIPHHLVTLGPRTLKGIRDPVEIYRVVLPGGKGESPSGSSQLPRLAVLPLANISPDPENEYFADGLTEELITVLSQIKGLRVISRTSVTQYKGTTKPVEQIGSELGVGTVLEGSVRKAGNQLRITVQLIDTRTDEHRWSQTFDRKLENVFAIQAEVAEQTAGALKVELLGPERRAIQERPTSSLAAYESYLRGIQASQQFGAGLDLSTDDRAVRYFEDAIRQDPKFAAAYARLASHLILVMGETRSTSEVVPRIRELVARALELNPDSSDAHTAQGALAMQVDHNWDGAEAELRRAIELNPGNSAAREHYGLLLGVLQRFDEEEGQFRSALELDPHSNWAHYSLAVLPGHRGDVASAIERAKELAKSHPELNGAHSLLASLYALTGRKDQALSALEPQAASNPPFHREIRAFVLALLGEPEEARAYIADWEAGRIPERYALRYAAALCAASGDDDKALTLLERDSREGDRALWHIYLVPAFDRVRQDPRFIALLRELNLPTTMKRRLLLRPSNPER